MRAHKKLLTAVALTAFALPSAAQAMTVADFLTKVQALKTKGIFAVGSADIGLLKKEVAAASDSYRAGLAAEMAAGRKASSCPPPKGTAKIGSSELIASFTAIPPAKRGISVKTAFAEMMRKRYPCSNISIG
ncbi:MAG: hypothetical protein WC803_04705 [Sphingomonas sp.]|jgi:hypothetical protein